MGARGEGAGVLPLENQYGPLCNTLMTKTVFRDPPDGIFYSSKRLLCVLIMTNTVFVIVSDLRMGIEEQVLFILLIFRVRHTIFYGYHCTR